MPKSSADWFRVILTVVVVGAWFWWLYQVLQHINSAPKNDDGKTLGYDVYSRVKETLATVIPILTLVLGYWSGVKGAESAKADAADANKKADNAQDAANKAKDDATQAHGVTQAVLGAATGPNGLNATQIQQIIDNAKTYNANIFGNQSSSH